MPKCAGVAYTEPVEAFRQLKKWLFGVSRLCGAARFYLLTTNEGFAVRLGAADIMFARPNSHVPWQGPRFTGPIYLSHLREAR